MCHYGEEIAGWNGWAEEGDGLIGSKRSMHGEGVRVYRILLHAVDARVVGTRFRTARSLDYIPLGH